MVAQEEVKSADVGPLPYPLMSLLVTLPVNCSQCGYLACVRRDTSWVYGVTVADLGI